MSEKDDEILGKIVGAADSFYSIFDGISTISIIDSERVLKIIDGRNLQSGLKVGDIMPEKTVIREAVKTGKRVIKTVYAKESSFDYGYVAIGVAIKNREGAINRRVGVDIAVRQARDIYGGCRSAAEDVCANGCGQR